MGNPEKCPHCGSRNIKIIYGRWFAITLGYQCQDCTYRWEEWGWW